MNLSQKLLNSNKLILPFIFLIIVFFSLIVVKDFSSPLSSYNGLDVDLWEYMGYYYYKNFSISPHTYLIDIDFSNDQHFYPYGNNHAVQGWGIESCLWYALMYKLWGYQGNWLGYYYIFSKIITFLFAYLILKSEFTKSKSYLLALALTFLNFYSIQRYPELIIESTYHWTALAIISDFIFLRKLWYGKAISLQFILAKILFVLFSAGLEIGYLFGYTLTSFTLTILFSLLIFIIKLKRGKTNLKTVFVGIISILKTAETNKISISALILLILSGIYVYVPILLEILTASTQYDASQIHGNWWINPLRIFLPHFRIYNDASIFGDSSEGIGQGIIGWLILGFGLIGLSKTPKNERIIYLPFLLLLALCMFFHPTHFPTLKIFPWFTYKRVAGRATIIYSVIFTIFTIYALQKPKKITEKVIFSFLIIVGIYEFYVTYTYKYNDDSYLVQYDKSFFKYMEMVRNTKGEAVLDYPFCIIGGNGVGREENLAPLYTDNSSISTFQRFHEKKTIGHYYGRLTKKQIEKQVEHGWGNLMITETDNPFIKQKLKYCLNEKQLEEFKQFFQYNDFAGINLYIDLLPNETCVAEFYKQFGKPIIVTNSAANGRIAFIPKPIVWQNLENKEKGRSIYFSKQKIN